MPSPTVTITGNLKDLTGAANVGSVQIELVNYGSNVPRVSGTGILAQVLTTAVANGSGVFTATIWGNDVITPSTTYYNLTFLSSAGSPIATVPYLFTGTATIDLSTIDPLQAIPTQPFPQVSFSQLSGNIAVNQMNAGTGASSSSFWRGDGTWAVPSITIPAATPTTLGGVFSAAAQTHKFLTSIGLDGTPALAQPAFSDISGTVSATQLPSPGASSLGGVQSFATVSHQFLTGISTLGVVSAAQPAASDLSNGTTGSGSVVLATSPTMVTPTLGDASATSLTASGNVQGARVLIGDGSAASPSLALANSSTNGFYRVVGTGIALSIASAAQFLYGTNLMRAGSGLTIGFSSNVDPSAAATDTAISRVGANSLGVGNGTAGDTSGTLTARTLAASGATSGTTSLVAAATASGTLTLPAATDTLIARATTDTLTNKTLSTSGTGNHIQIGSADLPTAVGSSNTFLGTTNGSTVTFITPTRSVLDATAKGWQFLGSATGNTTTIGPVVWSGTFTQLMIMYIIKGYSGGTPVGRLLFGVGSISTTALTNGSNLSEGVTSPTSAPSIPGCPLAVTLSNIGRAGTCFVRGASGDLKSYEIIGQNGSPSVSSPPQMFRAAGAFSDLSTNLPLQRAQLTVYDTLTATSASANSFVTGTTIWVWGRNGD